MVMAVEQAMDMDDSASAPADFPSEGEIPVDYKIKCHLLGLTGDDLIAYDSSGAVAFHVRSSSVGTPPRRVKTLSDAAGVPLVSIARQGDDWQGFKGDSWECKDSLFTAKKTVCSLFKSEVEVLLSGDNSGDPRSRYRLKGSPFQRSCTIYRGDSIVAQIEKKLYGNIDFAYSTRAKTCNNWACPCHRHACPG